MTERIVVGVDGSEDAARALAYAAADAARRGAQLQVVSVARLPEYWGLPYGMSPPAASTRQFDYAEAGRQVARKAVEDLFAAHPALAGQVQVEIVGLYGLPTSELIEQARGADMLVLGHRGRGALASAMLGSVGLSCVVHAECPVTIVPPPHVERDPAAHAADTGMRVMI